MLNDLELPQYVVVEAIVGGIHDNSSETNSKREKGLGHGCVPYRWIEDLFPGWFEKEYYSIHSSFQGNCSY